MKHAALILLIAASSPGIATADPPAAIPRRIPPAGRPAPPELQRQLWERIAEIESGLVEFHRHPMQADVAIFTKAVRLALKFDEFYADGHFKIAEELIQRAGRRLRQMQSNETPWAEATGLVVRGYRSPIDGSVQPYGLVIPENLDRSKPAPLYVWLHGRGDKITDLHFIHQRMNKKGTIAPPEAIVLHPFGRHCVGFKSAGEIDVLDAIKSVKQHYRIDADRIVIMGFSMGGAGAWHVGADYADHWAGVHAGAGFAETAQYNRLKPEAYPPQYEQDLWGLYDVPDYVRNLFNIPVIAYSGENDRQIQAARVMESAFRLHGERLRHVIGPGMGHKYHPESLTEVMSAMAKAVEQGRPVKPRRVLLQTRTLRYARQYWVRVTGLEHHWRDTRVDAEIVDTEIRGNGTLAVTTTNVTNLELTPPIKTERLKIVIDGTSLDDFTVNGETIALQKTGNVWTNQRPDQRPRKRPGLQGPLDDAFLEPFLLVTPSGPWTHAAVKDWTEFEIDHFRERWQALFRGRVREQRDVDVSPDDLENYHIVTWGNPKSNQLLARVAAKNAEGLQFPVSWPTDETLQVAGRDYNAAHHVPVCCYPNPLAHRPRYLVLNSGLTFREDHDRTNSLQNPKLPDWAVLDIRQAPSASAAGRVVIADFFDENWRW